MNDGRQMRDVRPERAVGSSVWLNAYVWAVALSILVLICSGGLVTSKGVGLAVPDWPNTYGYNVFAFPISRWVGGVLFEHVHRLIASCVGFLTIGLTTWICLAERRRWVRNLAIAALVAVIVQAVLGGLRVRELNAELGLFHACLAQAFLALVALLALVTSGWWVRLGRAAETSARRPALRGLLQVLGFVIVFIYVQLGLGATMRHAHNGLSIPDFPTAYGQAWPHVDAARLAQINQERDTVLHLPPTTVAQIRLQMAHRLLACLIAVTVLVAAVMTWNGRAFLPGSLVRLGLAGPVLIACQVALGIETIWTNKAADIATAHVAVGALSLVWSVLTYAALRRWLTQPRTGAVADQMGDYAGSNPRLEVGV